MAAISMPIAARAEYALHQLAKRDKNWAQREPGVIVVFVIVFLVAVLVIAMFINKKIGVSSSNVRVMPCSDVDSDPRDCSVLNPSAMFDDTLISNPSHHSATFWFEEPQQWLRA
ncbi:hypothetical protein IG631_12147 [Alternaria alternata]|nr:hypothetical protein IG631_12147 [Alternaria alternata]